MAVMHILPASRAARTLVAIHLLAALAITAQQTLGRAQSNNFTIFRASFWHLVREQDLYAAYPGITFDLFKYSPSYALLFAPFAVVPNDVGLLLWNLVNAAALCFAVVRLLPGSAAAWALAICLFEAIGAIQNTQSNGLVAGLMIAGATSTWQHRSGLSSLSVMGGAAIKVFPLSVGVFGLLSPTWRKYLIWCACVAALLLAAPLLVTPLEHLLAQYRSWSAVEARDLAKTGMWWIGGVLEVWSGRALPHVPFQIAGAAWLATSVWCARRQLHSAAVQQLLVASVLGFAVVFNHMSEPPTFVIGFAGVGIWWAALPRTRWRDAMVLAVVLLGSIGGSDIVPHDIQREWHYDTRLKAWVMIAAWAAMQWDLSRLVRRQSEPVSPAEVERMLSVLTTR